MVKVIYYNLYLKFLYSGYLNYINPYHGESKFNDVLGLIDEKTS